MELQGKKTEQNLWTAFSAESAARTRYDLYARALRVQGRETLARLFDETARNELAHAENWFEALGVDTAAPQALLQAAAGEHEEWTRMYAAFEREAREEGLEPLARRFALTAGVEKAHEEKFREAERLYADGKTQAGDTPAAWRCENCGYEAVATAAPQNCPLCGKPQGWFRQEQKR